jgi:hypothetical protein
MKAISLQQPWAWLMVNGHKDIENRKWTTSLRGPVLVHASKTFDHESVYLIQDILEELYQAGDFKVTLPEKFDIGGIVGMFNITQVVTESDNPWFFGPYGFVVKEARPLPFFPLRGQLNFFEVSDDTYLTILKAARDQAWAVFNPKLAPSNSNNGWPDFAQANAAYYKTYKEIHGFEPPRDRTEVISSNYFQWTRYEKKSNETEAPERVWKVLEQS